LSLDLGTCRYDLGASESVRDTPRAGRADAEALLAAGRRRHDAVVLKLWNKAKEVQLDLLDEAAPPAAPAKPVATGTSKQQVEPTTARLLSIEALCEDPNNPRTEVPEAELKELAEDIRQHGILQPIVVHPADVEGRHRIHFGAKRWRAAQRAGLLEVPVVVRDAPADPYAQVAENQKRHGLTPLDLARFIRARVDAGDSNATIAKRLGMDLTSIAHHLALLDLPPELNEAMQTGRCTSPRTLYELNKLHRAAPDRVTALLAGDGEITRSAVNEFRGESVPTVHAAKHRRAQPSLLAQAEAACARLELALARVAKAEPRVADADLASLKERLAGLGSRLA
jgi:ParB family transcriptional regulator, chromosome partitioning protein